MGSGISDAVFPMPIREVVALFSTQYAISQAQATSVVYTLLESGALIEKVYHSRFMETQVQVTLPLEELDTIIRQVLKGESEDAFAVVPTPSSSPTDRGMQVTATIPPGSVKSPPVGVESLHSAFSRIVSAAHHTLRISSPYIEQSGLNLLLNAFQLAATSGSSLRLLTRIDDRARPDMRKITALLTLYELFAERIEVRSFAKSIGQGQHWLSLGGVHAKILIADDASAYIGSGEIRDHSLNRNFEVGVVINDAQLTTVVSRLFDTLWEVSSEITVEYCRSFVK